MLRTLLFGSAAVMLVFTGLVHGLWTERWSDQHDLSDAALRLEQIPLTVGPWQGKAQVLEDVPNSGLAGTMARRYTHAATGKGVTLYLACGRPKAAGTHTPDVCYVGSGYQMIDKKRFALPAPNSPHPPEFLTARFDRQRQDGQTSLRIFWTWLAGDQWQVDDYPRIAFAREPVVHKMYLIRELASPDEPVETDPCVAFMHDMLPVLQRTLSATPR